MSEKASTATAGLRGHHPPEDFPPVAGPTWSYRKMSQIQRKLGQTGRALRDTKVEEETPWHVLVEQEA